MSVKQKTGESVGLVIIAILIFVTGFFVMERMSRSEPTCPEQICPEQVCPTCPVAAACEKCPGCPQDVMIVEVECEEKVKKPGSKKVGFQYHACNPGKANSFSGICDGKTIIKEAYIK